MEGLNQDQIEAVARKPEVTTSIRELEEIEKQLVLFEAELAREKQDQIKAQEQEIKNQVAQAVSNTMVLISY
jgi:DNA mismatch repair ATPase MutS